jgi:hypothetical protein
VHEKLVNENRCRIYGVTNDILKDPARRADLSLNQYGAMQLETHHYVIEWALANAIDLDKFNKNRRSIRRRTGTAVSSTAASPTAVVSTALCSPASMGSPARPRARSTS